MDNRFVCCSLPELRLASVRKVCAQRSMRYAMSISENNLQACVFHFLDENRIISENVISICVVLFHAEIQVMWHSTKPAEGASAGKQQYRS